MRPIEFPGHNLVFAKDQPQYQPLPAHRAADGTVTTCWQLSWRERLRVLVTGRLYFSQPPVAAPLQPQLPSVEPPAEIIAGAVQQVGQR